MNRGTPHAAIIAVAFTLAIAPSRLAAEEVTERFSIYAYLSQAYAVSDDHLILGIPTDGTFDYRTAALQFRYQHDDRNAFVVQLSHERNGEDLLQDRDDVELDWVFYQHTFDQGTAVQVGRLPIPFGIFNGIRDVGTILPFYRPYAQIYQEGPFVSETLDGILVAHTFAAESTWALEAEAYTGEWETINNSGALTEVDDAVGIQLWLSTPVSGMRVGTALQESEVTQHLGPPRGTEISDFETLLVSLDLDRERFMVRAENQVIDFSSGGEWRAWYVLAGIKPLPRLGIFGQYGEAELTAILDPRVGLSTIPVDQDISIGVSFAFRPEVVIKVEHHWNDGFSALDLPPFPFFGPTFETEFSIVSLSVSY
jgi:hypothetical protein